MDKRIREVVEQSDMVLVGIGAEFSVQLPEFEEVRVGEVLQQYLASEYYAGVPDTHPVLEAYRELRELIGKRPYFVVTLNTDDLIYRSPFAAEQIVAPCGSMGKLQCAEHIVEAKEIREKVLEAWRSSGKTFGAGTAGNAGDEEKMGVAGAAGECAAKTWARILKEYAVCPVCGAPLNFHTIGTEGYLESGYLPQWERYKKWLTGTLNRRLCVLELGVGFEFPQVIRWPFERTVFYNKKATLVRVHSRFPQVEAELSEKAVAVAANPVDALVAQEG